MIGTRRRKGSEVSLTLSDLDMASLKPHHVIHELICSSNSLFFEAFSAPSTTDAFSRGLEFLGGLFLWRRTGRGRTFCEKKWRDRRSEIQIFSGAEDEERTLCGCYSPGLGSIRSVSLTRFDRASPSIPSITSLRENIVSSVPAGTA